MAQHAWAGSNLHRMHKRARATASATTTRAKTTAGRATADKSTSAAGAAALSTAATTSGSNQPGAAASGTATRAVPSGPPTNSKGVSTLDNTAYSVSFAAQQSGYSISAQSTSAGSSSLPSSSAHPTTLSTGALIGIIAGGAVAGVLILALGGWCCWKRKKAKKDEAKWWSLNDDPSTGAVKNLGAANGGGKTVAGKPVRMVDGSGWGSTEALGASASSLAGGGTEKEWSQFGGDEKGRQYAASPAPSQPRSLDAARAELFAAPSAARNLTPSPSMSTLQTQNPPQPFNQTQLRPETGAYSVNDVISFSGGARSNTQYPPASSIYPPSAVDYPRSAPTPPPQSQPRQPTTHQAFNGVLVGPAPITAANYAPTRPPRPSEVPSAPPSPYNHVKRAERPTSRDGQIAGRFMDVMTGKVGVEEDGEEMEETLEEPKQTEGKKTKKRQSIKPSGGARSKKDTIIGLTDAYAGGGEEEWAQVDIDSPARQSTLPQRTASKRSVASVDSPTKPSFPPMPSITSASFPQPPSSSAETSTSTSANPNHNSSRIDSKPLKELESYFGSFAPPSRAPRTLSGVSETTMGSERMSLARRESVASSVAPLNFNRRPVPSSTTSTPGGVSASGSNNSLSPLAASQPGKAGAYGELTRHAHSIYSTAGELGELSSASGSSAGSPPKSRAVGMGDSLPSNGSLGTLSSTTTAQSPLSERTPVDSDVFESHPLADSPSKPPTSLPKPAASSLAPLRLTRNASLAHRQDSSPESSSPPTALTLSTAERDVFTQLGLATPSAGERTPDLSLSSPYSFDDSSEADRSSGSSSNGIDTPSTPQFPLPAALPQIVSPNSHYLDASPSSLPSSSPSPSPLKVPTTGGAFLDPLLARQMHEGGFDQTLGQMAGDKMDPNYRSATWSVYDAYS
ncbi:hypothetical protein JCM1840_005787 [Sporobolomyces johnsonii]